MSPSPSRPLGVLRRPSRLVPRLLLSLLVALAVLVGQGAPPVLALGTPTPLAPPDSDTPITPSQDTPLAIPEFRWTAVPDATRYRIQFSMDPGFAVKYEYTTVNTSYTPTDSSKFADGTWHWRVRADAPSPPGDYSAAWSFVKQWARDENAPALLAPEEGAALTFYDATTFTWEPVTGAASYRFQIATSTDGFATPTYNQTTLSTAHQPTSKLAGGTYYWRVIPRDANDREGIASEARGFQIGYPQVPTLLEPEHGATPTFTPSLRWTAVLGAQFYRLQYSTYPTFSSGTTQVDTRNTTYTPLDDLPNDVNYYWRVRAHSGASVSNWSEVRTFVKRWYLQPVLLTPTGGFQLVDKPFFSWTPVPGARRYKFELNNVNSFPPSGPGALTRYTSNPYLHVPVGDKSLTPGVIWYWRVTPLDANNNSGKPSAVSSFVTSLAPGPMLISPLYYYPPNDYGADAEMHPHEDRTAALPIFAWHRVPVGTDQAAAYRVQVSTDPLFGSTAWTADTENLFATPTAGNPFAPQADTDYYWRVAALDEVGGDAITPWSEVWKARFDTGAQMAPDAAGSAPGLLRPAVGSEWTEATPLLEWRPVEGATAYEVEISTDPAFAAQYRVNSAEVPYTAYAPGERIAYTGDPATVLPYGTYYWRVRALTGGTPGGWSEAGRFQIASQSRWRLARVLGDAANRVQIASDPAGDMATAGFDLSTLHVVQSADYWFLGFHVEADPEAAYVLYLDLDHEYESGGTLDPRGYAVATVPEHRPEYVIYIGRSGGAISAEGVGVYRWTGSAWATPQTLSSAGGALSYDSGHLELQVPNTLIGMEERTGSAAVSLFSVRAAGGHAQDTVPSDPNVAYAAVDTSGATTTLSRFASVSDRLMLVLPANLAQGEGTEYPSLPPFFWQPPVDTDCYGYYVQVALDVQFTSPVLDHSFRTKNVPGFDPPFLPYTQDLGGDNTYYWRVRPYYTTSADYRGAWSEPFSFEREGFVPQGLDESVTLATPTFSWDVTEGASGYDLQVSTDPEFGSTAISVNDLARNSYTWTNTLANATYDWRVRIRREGGIINDWSPAERFELSLPTPQNLRTVPEATADAPAPRAPTLCWDAILAAPPEGGEPVLAAWKYRVQVAKDPSFSTIWDKVDTEQPCWSPTKGYDDGTYYWRVAMIDGNGKLGDYAPAEQFTKRYPVPQHLSPTSGSAPDGAPTFVWEPVTGAAKYRIEVSLYENFGTTLDAVTTNNPRYTPTKAYKAEGYYWRVQMIDRDNRPGPFETVQVGPPVVDYEFEVFLPLVQRG